MDKLHASGALDDETFAAVRDDAFQDQGSLERVNVAHERRLACLLRMATVAAMTAAAQ